MLSLIVTGKIASRHCIDLQASKRIEIKSPIAVEGGLTLQAPDVIIRKGVVIQCNGVLHIAKFNKMIAPDCHLVSPSVKCEGANGSVIKGSLLVLTCKYDKANDVLTGTVFLSASKF